MAGRRPAGQASEFDLDLHLAKERMAGLHDDAQRARSLGRRRGRVVAGLRGRVGRGLIALGSAIAPERALVSGPARRP
jgi:hypothetical protein